MDEDITGELKDRLDDLKDFGENWNKYLAVTTAIIAVLAAIASLESGNFSNQAILEKDNAILNQNKATDQWNYYQAKGIKKNVAEAFYQQTNDQKLKTDIEKYSKEQIDIQKQASSFEKQVEEANTRSEKMFENHHQEAIAVTFFQVAIALSAMSALLKRKSFWLLSVLLTIIGLKFFITGLVK